MNSENSETSESQILILKLSGKLDLIRDEKSIASSNLSNCYTWKNIKSLYNNNNIKTSAATWSDKFKFLMDHILYEIFKIVLSIFKKTWRKR